jgi:hypothetical protein
LPVIAPAGTVAVRLVSESTVKLAPAPPKATRVAPVKKNPVTVTSVPTGPLVGLKEVITGGAITMKSLPLEPVPSAVVTLIFPVVAEAGTIAVRLVSEATVKLALTPLNLTAVAPVK